MRNLIIRLLVNAVALWVASRVVPGIALTQEVGPVLLVAAVFGLVNALIKPVVFLLSLPVVLLTLGLFTIVINALMLMLTDWLMDSLTLSGFWAALLGSLLISLVSLVLSVILPDGKD